MKKIINGKVYDTDTAQELGLDCGGDGFAHWCEKLYLKRTGEYFIYGSGGPMTKYAQSVGQNSWSEGEKIIPVTAENARKWAEEHLDVEDYADVFGMPDDDSETRALYIVIPAPLMAQLKSNAAMSNQTLKNYVISLLTNALN